MILRAKQANMQDVPENSKYIKLLELFFVPSYSSLYFVGDHFGKTQFDYNKALSVLGVKPSLFHSLLTTGQTQEVTTKCASKIPKLCKVQLSILSFGMLGNVR